MARPLRLEIPGGWYHVSGRGNERQRIFRSQTDRFYFLELLEEWVDRFFLRLHAYVLMDNHYHLLVETRQPNLSQAMQWLAVSYTVWFNRKHDRVGHLFQGRYKAILIEASSSGWELSRYIHLNPVRIARLGLDKESVSRSRQGLRERPDPEEVKARLERLRTYPWSSYRACVGLAEAAPWLTTRRILEKGQGRTWKQRIGSYRQYVEQAVREGLLESPWQRVEGQMFLGGLAFVARMKKLAGGNEREQSALKTFRRRASFKQVIELVEVVKGERWGKFRDRYGDWGRDLALYIGRRHCGLKLRELVEASGGLNYGSISNAVRRFARRAAREEKLGKLIEKVRFKLMKDET